MAVPSTPGVDMKSGVDTLAVGILATCLIVALPAVVFLGFVLFHGHTDAAYQRRWFPRYVILSHTLFLALLISLTTLITRSPVAALGFSAPFVLGAAFFSYIVIKLTRFCDKCGALDQRLSLVSTLRFCSKCGSEIPS